MAQHYQTIYVPEYARIYIDRLQHPYTLADIEQIAKGQMQLEDTSALLAKRLLFCDTDLTVTQIWAKHVFGTSCPYIEQQLQQRKPYNLYLLMDIDLPWQPDPQREHPHLRQYLFDWYQQELITRKVNYVVISGNQNQRLQNAINAIEGFLCKTTTTVSSTQ